MKTRAAVLHSLGAPLVVEELEVDEPKEREVLVRIVASGVCHSDHHVISGFGTYNLPMVLGHEGAGIVEQVGSLVTRVKPGDHVVLSFIPSCGNCYFCLHGMSNLCDQGALLSTGAQLDGTNRLHKGSQDVSQMLMISTFSEWTVAPEASVVKIDPQYRLDRACLMACAGPTGAGAAIHRAKVEPGSSVLVVGCGGVGSFALQGARIAGADTIIAADTVDFKLEMAIKHFGATHAINNAKEDLVARVKDITNGIGVDYAFEAIATAETIGLAFQATRKAGKTVVIGIADPKETSIPISPIQLPSLQKSLLGTLYGSSVPATDIPRFLRLYRQGHLKLDEMVTREYRLNQINDAFRDMLDGRIIRGVVRMD